MAALTWDKIFDKLLKQMERMEKRAERTAGRTGSLADNLESVGDQAHASGKHTGALVAKFKDLGKAVMAVDAIVGQITKKTVDWQTASRKAVRGSVLLADSTDALRANYLRAQRAGLDYAEITGASADEALRMAVSVETAMSRASRRIEGGAGNASKYLEEAAAMSLLLGMDANDSIRFTKLAVEDMGVSFRDAGNILGDATAASKVFGVSANNSMQALQDHMDRIQALDESERAAYAKKLLYAVGVQEQASVKFGKYTDTLTGSQGTDKITKTAFLSSLSGMGAGDLMKAAANPHDAQSQIMLMEAVRKAAEKVSPGFVALDKQMRSDPSKLTNEQAMQHAIEQQKLIQTLGQFGGVNPDQIVQMSAALDRASKRDSFTAFTSQAQDPSGARGMADLIKTQAERDASFEVTKAKALGAGTDLHDRMLDVYGSYERHIKKTVLELIELASSAAVLAKIFWGMGGSQIFGMLGGVGRAGLGAVGGIAGRVGGMLGAGGAAAGAGGAGALATLSKIGTKAGIAGLVIEAGLAINKVSSEEGRAEMRAEIGEAVEQAGTLTGSIKNFGKAFISPTESIMKVGMMAKDAMSYWAEVQAEQERAQRHKAMMDKQIEERRREAGKTEDGERLLAFRSRSAQILDIFAHSTGEQKNYHNRAEISTMLASASKSGRSEADVMAELNDRNKRYAEAIRTGDSVAKAAIDAEFKQLRELRNKVYFEGGALPSAPPTVTTGSRNEPVKVSVVPTATEERAQQNTVAGTEGINHEMIDILKGVHSYLADIAAASERRSMLPA